MNEKQVDSTAPQPSDKNTDTDATKLLDNEENDETFHAKHPVKMKGAMKEILEAGKHAAAQKAREAAQGPDHKFWYSQPVATKESGDQSPKEDGPIETNTDVSAVRTEGYRLPEGFVWDTLDVTDSCVLSDIHELLNLNYVEDDDAMFRFGYSKDFLLWSLTPPNYLKEWHVGIRTESKKLLALITGIPATIQVHGKSISMAEINFLCVHKALRTKRLAPVLIREITRRVNLTGRWQAVYTAGVKLPYPVGAAKYFHRPLDIKKLIECRFSHLGQRNTLKRAQKLFRVPEVAPLFRIMEGNDCKQVLELLRKNLGESPELTAIFETEDDVKHWLLPRDEVVYSYVKESNGCVTDFISFYNLPSTVIGSSIHDQVKAAYCFYHAATSLTTEQALTHALHFAKQLKFDVFNALQIHENTLDVLKNLNFGLGDGCLHYYLYNWRCPPISQDKIALILL
eukprot:GHVP01000640.1.p1 GENE.GHVP01000640.1~~GHVP01000640.1.p1  ORF type:complete len:470 (+),score=69.49 GHVP01000640.1:48-1412(+)